MERSDIRDERLLLASVVVPTFNRPTFLRSCLKSLIRQRLDTDSYEIIVVDDGSPQNMESIVGDVMGETSLRWRFLRTDHRGPASARNSGIQHSDAPIVVFIDDDCTAEPSWLREILRPFSSGSIDGVEGRVVRHDESTPFTHFVENLAGGQFLTANIAYRRETLVALENFDESYQQAAAEDWDLAFRVLERGGKILFASKATVVHLPVPMRGRDFIDRRKETSSTIRLYKRFPQLWEETTGRSLRRSFQEGILLGPVVEARKWRKYFRAHRSQLPRYLFWQTLASARLLIEFVRVSYGNIS